MNDQSHHAAKSVTAERVRQWLGGPDEIAFLDVREEGQFGWGHPLLAANLPYSRLELDIAALVPRLDTRIVLIDDDEAVASRAAIRLRGFGYTDLNIVVGGVAGWTKAGLKLFEGVHVPSKAFAEVVEHAFDTPSISAEGLKQLIDRKADFVVLDSRTEEEFARFHVPGAVSVPGAELVHHFADVVPSGDTLVVVSCAGRTRGIIGAQSLINAGVDNKVVVLAGGTQGWRLASLELEKGARSSSEASAAARRSAQGKANRVNSTYGVSHVDHARLRSWRADPNRTTYVFDVRTPAEFERGHLPFATSIPGAQLLQSLDLWAAVHRARIVLVDDDGVRASVTAHWLVQMGWDVHVLDNALDGQDLIAGKQQRVEAALPSIATIAAADAVDWLGDSGRIVSVSPSGDFREGHPKGAIWSIRPRLRDAITGSGAGQRILVVGRDEKVAALAAGDLAELGADVRVLAGGDEAWLGAGLAWEVSGGPADADRVDFLTWNFDRHLGNPAASRAYLAWEGDLPRQIEEDGTAYYRIAAPALEPADALA